MNKKIGVLGCGWLGLPLAKHLLEKGFDVKGTTTSQEKMEILKKARIEAFIVQISEDKIEGDIKKFLIGTDTLIVNIPPKLRGKGPKENYVRKMKFLISQIELSTVRKVIFVSSTSVYGNNQGEVNEETLPLPTSESGKQLLATEQLLLENQHFQTTIIRFAGLIGPDRHPVSMLSGKSNLTGGNAPVNLIHLNDCIGIITTLVQNNIWEKIINGVYPKHPTKEAYYTQKAIERQVKPPFYDSSSIEKPKKVTSCSPFFVKYYRFSTSI